MIKFLIYCGPEIAVTLRVLNLFAQRLIHPVSVNMRVDSGGYRMQIETDSISEEAASLIAEKILSQPMTFTAEVVNIANLDSQKFLQTSAG